MLGGRNSGSPSPPQQPNRPERMVTKADDLDGVLRNQREGAGAAAVQVRPFVATGVMDMRQALVDVLTPELIGNAMAANPVLAGLGAMTQGFPALQAQVTALQAQVNEVHNEVRTINTRAINANRRARNQAAAGAGQWVALVKSVPGIGPSLPNPTQLPAGNAPLVAVDRPVDQFPATRADALALQHADLNYFAMVYNEQFGIVAGDVLAVRRNKFVDWATQQPNL